MLIEKCEPVASRATGGRVWAPMPVIVGSGRCGTTLLRMMLDAHPDIAIPPETHFIPQLVGQFSARIPSAQELVSALESYFTWSDFGIDPQRLEERLNAIEPFDLTEALRTFYALYAERFGKPRWGDKTPLYFAHMTVVQQVLPEATFIHLIRDGRDVALSIQDLWFGPNSIQEAAGWWAQRIEQARSQVPELRNYIEVRYEDLIVDPETVLRKICRFIDLSWNPLMLDYHERAAERLSEVEHDAPKHDKSGVIAAADRVAIFSLVKEPPRADRVGRWRQEMNEHDVAWFEREAGPLLHDLGYARS